MSLTRRLLLGYGALLTRCATETCLLDCYTIARMLLKWLCALVNVNVTTPNLLYVVKAS